MTEWMQDWTVTSVAALAAVVIVRRLAAFVRPVKGGDGCSSCGSRPRACAEREAPDAAQTTIPLQVLRGRTMDR